MLSSQGLFCGPSRGGFAGTLSLINGEFVAGTVWELHLSLPHRGTISHTYEARKV